MSLTTHSRLLCTLIFSVSVAFAVQNDEISEFRRAAEQGYPSAQTALGMMYYLGEGVPQDYAEAVAWCHRAAEQGNARGQIELGRMHYHGEGVPQNYTEAFAWCHRAAEQGNARGQIELGRMYEDGQGVPKDYVSAYMYYNLAVAKGQTDAREQREELATKMTADQITEAQRRARDWLPKTWEELQDR